MFAIGLHLAISAFTLGVYGQGKWEFYANAGLDGILSYGRLDPIVSPGQVSAHVHMIQAANAMSATYDYDTLRSESTCTTLQVQDDLSNYWAPAMYHYDGVGNFSLMMKSSFHIYYEFVTYSNDASNPSGSSQRYPFPEGLTMLAGDMMQRVINESDPRSTASVFQCQRADANNSPYDHDIRNFQKSGLNCDKSLRATTRFPSCWDGVANNSDLSHVVYPDSNRVCPESHPRAFMELTFEWYFPVQDYPFDPKRDDNWILSFGDNSGFGMHGDFANGWNITLLEEAIDQCNTSEMGIENCPPFKRWINVPIPPCIPSGLYPNEPVGLDGQSLTALPGCNPIWKGNVTKPTCEKPAPAPSIDLQLGPDLSKWNYLSCPFSWNDDHQMMFTAYSKSNWEDMTVDSCLAECSGYKYAMMMGGTNCYCDNEVRNGGSLASSPSYPCQVHCTDKYLEYCGGLGSGQVYKACEGDACRANHVSLSKTGAVPPAQDTAVAITTGGAGVSSSSTTSASISLSSSPPTATSSSGIGGVMDTGKQHQHKNHQHLHRHRQPASASATQSE